MPHDAASGERTQIHIAQFAKTQQTSLVGQDDVLDVLQGQQGGVKVYVITVDTVYDAE